MALAEGREAAKEAAREAVARMAGGAAAEQVAEMGVVATVAEETGVGAKEAAMAGRLRRAGALRPRSRPRQIDGRGPLRACPRRAPSLQRVRRPKSAETAR